MPDLVPGDVHVDRFLTDVSVDFIQSSDRFISDKVFPPVPVDHASDKFIIYNREDSWRDEMKVRPLGGRPDQASWGKSEGTFLVEERALEFVLDDRLRANADPPLAGDLRATRFLSQRSAVNADIRWATSFFGTGIWTTDQTGVAGAPGANQFQQFDQAGSDPVGTIHAQLNAVDGLTGFMPNMLVVGVDVDEILKNHADILDRVKHTQLGNITNGLLAQLFGVDRYLVARAIKTTSAEGAATATFARIVNAKAALLVYAAPEPARDAPSGGYTFAWTGLIPGATNVLGGVIERGRDERAHSDFFQSRTATDFQLVSADLGRFLDQAVA